MNAATRQLICGMVSVVGLVLMIGGIATGTNGAVAVGLIVAAASFGFWQRWRKA